MSFLTRLYRLLAAIAFALPVLASAQSADKPFNNEQLDQMLAQIALYPDSLLSQVLMAATYPEEFQEAAKWSKAHPDSKGDDAVKAVEGNDWDPSVASLVAFPEVVITLAEKPDYVKNLGDAFLAQPEDVMNSVQRLRAGAQVLIDAGAEAIVAGCSELPLVFKPEEFPVPLVDTIDVLLETAIRQCLDPTARSRQAQPR